MAETALYYPYIHIEDVNWLKATLLLFDRVQRITPTSIVEGDTHEIKEFAQPLKGGRPPLLEPAPLGAPKVWDAQERLAKQIGHDARYRRFRHRFSQEAELRQRREGDALGFQMNQLKMSESLRAVLAEHELIWDPRIREPYDRYGEYVALHPLLGEAIMSTLAVSCALTEGADIVGDKRSGRLHEALLGLHENEIYEAVLSEQPPTARHADAHELFEFVVAVACDMSKLGPGELAKLGANRQPIRDLYNRLSEHARGIGTMYEGKKRTQRFLDETSTILKAWRQDSMNMDAYWRRFLGKNLLEPGKDAMSALLEVGFSLASASGTGGAASLLASPLGPLAQAGAGVGLGLISHGVKSYVELRSAAGSSVYRHLSAMKGAGVIFLSELRQPPGLQHDPA